jgi:hypothetical protein
MTNDAGDRGSTAASAADEEIEHVPLAIVGGGIGGLVLALCLDRVFNHPPEPESSETKGNDDSSDAVAVDAGRGKPTRLSIEVYESTSAYTANSGGAIGLYSNGLRVLRDLSRTHPQLVNLLDDVRFAGCDYLYRRWMRHDGLEVAVAREDELLPEVVVHDDEDDGDDEEDEASQQQQRGAPTPRRSSFGSLLGAFHPKQQQQQQQGGSNESWDLNKG